MINNYIIEASSLNKIVKLSFSCTLLFNRLMFYFYRPRRFIALIIRECKTVG